MAHWRGMDGRLRPRFERFSQLGTEEVRDRLRNAIRDSGGRLVGEVLEAHAQLMISGEGRHTWSPCLWLTYRSPDERDDFQTQLRGLFGPRPAVWTLFALLYLTAACVAFFGAMFGWSQWLIDATPTGFYAVGGAAVVSGVLYIVGLSGKALAHDEMDELLSMVEGLAECAQPSSAEES